MYSCLKVIGNFLGFALSFLRHLGFRCKVSGCLFLLLRENEKSERKRGVSLSYGNYKGRAGLPSLRQSAAKLPSLTPGTAQD